MPKNKKAPRIPDASRWFTELMARENVAVALLMFFTAGCATAGTSSFLYVRSSPSTVENEIIVNKPFEETWGQLVKGLAKSFYVINNIEKSSRIINVSFFTESPGDFIDCGKSMRTYERGKERKEYVYDLASSSSFRVADKGGAYGQFPITHYVNRSTSLEGRTNIYVAPEGRKTVVSVNSRYILTIRVSGYSVGENAYGKPLYNQPIVPTSNTHSFNTNQPNTAEWESPEGTQRVTCYSTGKLEGEILSLAR